MKRIKNCLNRELTELCERSLQLQHLAEKVGTLLPAEFAKVCKVGSFTKGCLILTTSDAAWASQLRYLVPDLRDQLRKEAGFYQLSSIKIQLEDPGMMKDPVKKIKKHGLSDKAKASIISESEFCDYLPLKQALLNLAGKGKD